MGVEVLEGVNVKVLVVPVQDVKLSAGFWIQYRTETPDVVIWLSTKFFALQVPLLQAAVLSDLSP